MPQVRLASRAVISAFDKTSDVEVIIPELERLGVRLLDVSVIGKSEVVQTISVTERSRGLLGVFGKKAQALGSLQVVEEPGVGTLSGAGPLVHVLVNSPSTSPTGALVMQGIPQRDALIYSDLLKHGKVILLVGVADRRIGERVRAVFEQHAGQSIGYYAGRPYGTAYHGVGPGLR